jgi:hypothetical protein
MIHKRRLVLIIVSIWPLAEESTTIFGGHRFISVRNISVIDIFFLLFVKGLMVVAKRARSFTVLALAEYLSFKVLESYHNNSYIV